MITEKRPGLFLITRTSKGGFDPEDKPHEQAFLADIERSQTFDLHKYQATPTWFYQRGTSHRRVGDVGTRVVQEPAWLLEVSDLVAFVQAEGEIVLSIDDDWPSIEIYDNYRE